MCKVTSTTKKALVQYKRVFFSVGYSNRLFPNTCSELTVAGTNKVSRAVRHHPLLNLNLASKIIE